MSYNKRLIDHTIFSLLKAYYHKTGWEHAQLDLYATMPEFCDEMFEEGVVKAIYNDVDATLKSVAKALVEKAEAASDIKLEEGGDLDPVSGSAWPPYRITVKDCIFQSYEPLLVKYKIRCDYRRIPPVAGGHGPMFCPMMNIFTHAIDRNTDYLAGHAICTVKQDNTTCTNIIGIFSREVDVTSPVPPEATDPLCYMKKKK